MGLRAHVHTKHEIEYGEHYFNWRNEEVFCWLTRNGVTVVPVGHESSDEWEIDKDDLRKLKPEVFKDEHTEYGDLSGEEMKAFVKSCLDAPTGDYAYVSWF